MQHGFHDNKTKKKEDQQTRKATNKETKTKKKEKEREEHRKKKQKKQSVHATKQHGCTYGHIQHLYQKPTYPSCSMFVLRARIDKDE